MPFYGLWTSPRFSQGVMKHQTVTKVCKYQENSNVLSVCLSEDSLPKAACQNGTCGSPAYTGGLTLFPGRLAVSCRGSESCPAPPHFLRNIFTRLSAPGGQELLSLTCPPIQSQYPVRCQATVDFQCVCSMNK